MMHQPTEQQFHIVVDRLPVDEGYQHTITMKIGREHPYIVVANHAVGEGLDEALVAPLQPIEEDKDNDGCCPHRLHWPVPRKPMEEMPW